MAFGSNRKHAGPPGAPIAPARPGSAGAPPAPGPLATAVDAAPSIATSPAAPPAIPAAPTAGSAATTGTGSRLVRPYTLTGGRTRSEAADFPIETLVVTTADGTRRIGELAHEQRRIAQLCGEPISVAEVAARIGVPLGVARVLVGDLSADGVVDVHRPNGGDRTDLKLLERVLGGIRAL